MAPTMVAHVPLSLWYVTLQSPWTMDSLPGPFGPASMLPGPWCPKVSYIPLAHVTWSFGALWPSWSLDHGAHPCSSKKFLCVLTSISKGFVLVHTFSPRLHHQIPRARDSSLQCAPCCSLKWFPCPPYRCVPDEP